MRLRFKIGDDAWAVDYSDGKITGFKILAMEIQTEVLCFDFMDNYYNQDTLHRTYQQAEKSLNDWKGANNEAKENPGT